MVKEAIADNGKSSSSESKPKGGFGGSETIEGDHINYTYLGVHRALGRVVFWVGYVGSTGDQRPSLVGVGAQVSFFIGLHVAQDAFGGRRWRQMNKLQILRKREGMHNAGNV
jgi:hypothetical protein